MGRSSLRRSRLPGHHARRPDHHRRGRARLFGPTWRTTRASPSLLTPRRSRWRPDRPASHVSDRHSRGQQRLGREHSPQPEAGRVVRVSGSGHSRTKGRSMLDNSIGSGTTRHRPASTQTAISSASSRTPSFAGSLVSESLNIHPRNCRPHERTRSTSTPHDEKPSIPKSGVEPRQVPDGLCRRMVAGPCPKRPTVSAFRPAPHVPGARTTGVEKCGCFLPVKAKGRAWAMPARQVARNLNGPHTEHDSHGDFVMSRLKAKKVKRIKADPIAATTGSAGATRFPASAPLATTLLSAVTEATVVSSGTSRPTVAPTEP